MNHIPELLKLLDWATGDDTGVSSKALCRFMLGLKPNRWGLMAPSDMDDRSRCIRPLNLMPEWWDRLMELARVSVEWSRQIPLLRQERKLYE